VPVDADGVSGLLDLPVFLVLLESLEEGMGFLVGDMGLFVGAPGEEDFDPSDVPGDGFPGGSHLLEGGFESIHVWQCHGFAPPQINDNNVTYLLDYPYYTRFAGNKETF